MSDDDQVIFFCTNLDKYRTDHFPKNLKIVPRKGEFVSVKDSVKSYYAGEGLPSRLEVVSVTHNENGIVCELWYNSTDFKVMKFSNINPF